MFSTAVCGNDTTLWRAGILALGAAVLLCLAPSQTHADSRIYGCPEGAAEDLGAARELLQKPWDTAGLACGAQLYIAAADSNSGDTAGQLAALRANERYMYYLDKVVLYELGYLINWYVDDVPEEKKLNAPMRAMLAAQQEQRRLVSRLRDAQVISPELDYFDAQTLGVSADAQPLLRKAVSADPPALAGAAHALQAEIYYALPDILGGDLDEAVTLMRAASERAPHNPRYSRILAGYLLDLNRQDEARATLRGLLELTPEPPGLQLQADQLRSAAELAARLGDPQLAGALGDARDGILRQHPYLQNRKVVSAMGHFGSNDPREE